MLGNACQAHLRLAAALAVTPIEGIDPFAPSSQIDKLPEELRGFKVICAVDTPSARLAYLVAQAKGENRYAAGYAKDIAGMTDEDAVKHLIELSKEKKPDPTLLPQKTWLTGADIIYLCPAVLARYANACLPNVSLSYRPEADEWMSQELRMQCQQAYEDDTRRLTTLVMWNGDDRTPFTAFGECEPCKKKAAAAKAK